MIPALVSFLTALYSTLVPEAAPYAQKFKATALDLELARDPDEVNQLTEKKASNVWVALRILAQSSIGDLDRVGIDAANLVDVIESRPPESAEADEHALGLSDTKAAQSTGDDSLPAPVAAEPTVVSE